MGELAIVSWRDAEQCLKSRGVDSFIFEQLLRDQLELIAMAGEDLFGFGVGLSEDFFHLGIDKLGGLFAAIALESAIRARQEQAIMFLGAAREADGVAHAK